MKSLFFVLFIQIWDELQNLFKACLNLVRQTRGRMRVAQVTTLTGMLA